MFHLIDADKLGEWGHNRGMTCQERLSMVFARIIHRCVVYLLLSAFIICMPQAAVAEKKVFVKEYPYQASEIDSKVTSRAIALQSLWNDRVFRKLVD